NTRPKVVRGNLFAQATKMRRTLGEYYRDRMRLAGRQHPAFFDHELKTIFPARSSREPADIFLERVRPFVIESTIKATGKQRYFVQEKYRLFKARCDALGLSSPPSVSE